jgi:hypothetical protein
VRDGLLELQMQGEENKQKVVDRGKFGCDSPGELGGGAWSRTAGAIDSCGRIAYHHNNATKRPRMRV